MTQEYNTQPQGSSYLIIGSGRLATHLAHYFTLLKHDFSQWSRKSSNYALKDLLLKKPTVILAISDFALDSFYRDFLHGNDLTVVHCSGAFHSDHMISCHPLMTFGPDLYTLENYKKIFFAVTGVETLQQVFPFLPNASFVLKPKDKPLYHALCVLTGAGTQNIWSKSEKLLSTLGVPHLALKPYIQQITENYLKTGSAALTGPWIRKDEKTIQKNMSALSEASPHSLFKIYDILKEGQS